MNRREALMALCSIPAVASVARADVGPKDVIVIRSPGELSDEEVAHIQSCVKQAWPGHKCLVMGNGMSVEIVRQA